MATGDSDFSWRDIHPLDIVTPAMESIRHIPEDQLLSITQLLSTTWSGGEYALLYQCKDNRTLMRGKCSKLGLTDENTEYECRELSGRKFQQALQGMAGGRPRIYALTSGGQLLTCGDQNYGALGRPADDASGSRFGYVSLDGVQHIDAGADHCLAMTSEKVYAFGYNGNNELGKTGQSSITDPCEMHDGIDGSAPLQVACGYYHSVVLTVDGKVFTCGEGCYGATCQGSTGNITQLTPVKTLESKHVVQIGCTQWATYALADGILYVSGENSDGRAGLGHKGQVIVPTPIDFGNRQVDSFRCYEDMVVVKCTSDETFYFGHCKGEIIMKPRQVEVFRNARDVFVKAEYPGTGGLVCMEFQVRRHRELEYLQDEKKKENEQQLQIMRDLKYIQDEMKKEREQRETKQENKLQQMKRDSYTTKRNLWICLATLYALIVIIFYDVVIFKR